MTILYRDVDWYAIAYELAKTSECRYKFGAVLAYNNRILGMGVNKLKTHPIMRRYGNHCISIHAEVACILNARNSIDNATLYIARYSDGDALASKPCAVCMGIILEKDIKYIVYHANGTLHKEKTRE